MSRLYLLRHAKSSWSDPGLADHDRPLAPRGRRAAKAIGRYLREQDVEPALVLCSTAARTRETLQRIDVDRREERIERGLYSADAEALLARLREVPDEVRSVMLIGHNPGVQDLALLLARPGPELRALEAKFPTAALASFAVAGWSTLGPGTAELIDFVRPRDLER
jgi:phosphohistidine phosphatase